MGNKSKKKILIGWVIVFLPFIISLFQPVYCTVEYQREYNVQCGEFGQGAFMFLFGWLGFLNTTTAVVRLANPLMLFAFGVSFVKPYVSVVLSVIALFLALKFLNGGDFLLNEGGTKGYISEYLIGYWFWLTSIVLNVCMNVVLSIMLKKD